MTAVKKRKSDGKGAKDSKAETSKIKQLVSKHPRLEGLYREATTKSNLQLIEAAGELANLNLVKGLVETNAEVDCVNEYGETPVYLAAARGKLEIVNYLISQNADVNKARDDGITPLMATAFWGKFEVVKTLVENGADIEAQNPEGSNALAFAAAGVVRGGSEEIGEGSVKTVEYLMERGMKVDAKMVVRIAVETLRQAVQDEVVIDKEMAKQRPVL